MTALAAGIAAGCTVILTVCAVVLTAWLVLGRRR